MVTFFLGGSPLFYPPKAPKPIEAHLMQLSSFLASLHFEATDVALQLQDVPFELMAAADMKDDDQKRSVKEAPEKWWLEAYFPIGKVTFQGRTVKLSEGKFQLYGF